MSWKLTKVMLGLCGLLVLTANAATPEVGKNALRRLVKLPAIAFEPNWTFDPERGFTLGSAQEDVATQITALVRNLKHDISDAEKFQQLGELYSAVNDATNARKAWSRAAEIFRKRLNANPDDAVVLAGLGQALQGAGKKDEAESVLRKAVQIAPHEWRSRLALGRLLDSEARDDIYESPIADTNSALDKPSTGDVALAQRRLAEADDCFDRAVAAAPEESAVYLRRGLHRCLRNILLEQIRQAKGVSMEPPVNSYLTAEALADLAQASRLNEKDYALIGSTVLSEIYAVNARNGQMNWLEFSWSSLPDKSQRTIREAAARLENLGQDADPQVASGALEVLGILQGPVLHEPIACVTNLRRALALSPAREQAWEVLVSTLAQMQRYDELLAACEGRVKLKNTARSHLLLAKACEKMHQWEEAEAEITEAVNQSPNDFTANLALADLLLKRSQDDAMLPEANGWLTRAERLLKDLPAPQRSRQQAIDLTLTRSIYFALTDEVDTARQWAEAVIKTDQNNQLARDILSAMNY